MGYNKKVDAVVLLEDGAIFYGKAVDLRESVTGEICFNTGTTGYQEIFTDPSYYGQIMVTTNAHIGNYGIADDDAESKQVQISALVCKNFSMSQSRPRASQELSKYLDQANLFVVTDVDTRALVAHIRDHGAQNAIVSTDIHNLDSLKTKLQSAPKMKGLELASKVSTREIYDVGNPNSKFRVAAIDLGIKSNILENLSSRGVYVRVFPYNVTYAELEEFSPDGYFISNGPGDPQPLTDTINTAREIIKNKKPLFGICLGHQIIALASGIDTYKMHNGHRGINHPIMNTVTGKGEITSQNHGFAIDKEQTEDNSNVTITHYHLNDNTVAGIKLNDAPCFSVQYHPEAGPGPNDATYLFDEFVELMKNHKTN